MTTQALNTTEWAKTFGDEFSYVVALDNYEPCPRQEHYGQGWFYDMKDIRGSGIILDGLSALKDATNAVYLIDDGRSVQVFYVAGWKEDEGCLMLHPMPTNYHADGTPKMRGDDSTRQVDMSTWKLGPRRAYHLKVISA